MIDIEYIRSFFPPAIACESRFNRYMLKEYLQLLILDHLAIAERLKDVDLNHKKRDFSHLVFNEQNAERILQFPNVVAAL